MMLRFHSNAVVSDVRSPVQLRKSTKKVAHLKEEKSDAAARQQNVYVQHVYVGVCMQYNRMIL
jgi:hypothetical protein